MLSKLPVLVFAAVSGAIAVPTLLPSASGVESGMAISGYGPVPADCSALMPSCAQCHSGSAPSLTAPHPDTPNVAITTASAVRAIASGSTIAITTTITGSTGTHGGFCCETTSGTFTASPALPGATMIVTNPASITHTSNADRTWTYDFNAPAASGLIELTSAGNAVDGNFGPSGDHFSFSGFDRNAQQATPVRLYALPTGVINIGTACSDGYGNLSVLGANSSATVGNTGFELRLHGASPSAMAYAWAGFNTTPNYVLSLDGFGLTGCNSYIHTISASQIAVTSGGSTERAEGAAVFALPLVGAGALLGARFQVQAGYIDPSVVSPTVGAVSRTLPLSLSNGLEITLQ
jgi:hypothetical protein